MKNRPEILREQSAREAARGAVSQALGSYLPKVNLSLSYEEGRSAFEMPEIGASGPIGRSILARYAVSNPFRTQISASLPLYSGGEIPGRLAQSRASLRAAERTLEAQRQAIVLRVTEAYYGVLRADALMNGATASLNRSREIYRTTYKLAEVGMRSKAELLRSEVTMASAERDFLLAANALELARSTLNDAMARDLDAPVEPDTTLSDPQDLSSSVDDAISRGLRLRPDLLALREQASAMDGAVRAVRSSLLPGASLNANYAVVDDRPSVRKGRASWFLGGGLNWAIFDGRISLSRYREALHAREGMRYSVEVLERRVALEVKEAYLAVREAFDRIGLADRRLGSAREGYRAAEASYRAGKTAQSDLLGAQADLVAAEAENATARYDHLIAWARFRYLEGSEGR